MKTPHREVYYQNWKEIRHTLNELKGEPQRFQPQLTGILVSAFGSDTHKGLIPNRLSYYYKKEPSCWAEEVEEIVNLFSPDSALLFGKKSILNIGDYPLPINPKILPKSVLNEFPSEGDWNSKILKSLKREKGNQYFIDSWQWFWVHVGYALVNLPEVQQTRTLAQQQTQDQIYYHISRNPILLIIRNGLVTKCTDAKEEYMYQRMREIIEVFVIEELLHYVRSSYFRTQFKYELTSHQLAAMFLLVNSHREYFIGDARQIYHQYFQKATENFTLLSSKKNSNNNILRNLMRVWTFFITRKNSPDYYIIRQLANANPGKGWYKMERCPLDQWVAQAKKAELYSLEIPPVTATRNKIYNLLNNHSLWSPSFSFLAVLQQFVELDKHRLSYYIRSYGQKQHDEIFYRCFMRILTHLSEKGADSRDLQILQSRLNNKYLGGWDKELKVDFTQRKEETIPTFFKATKEHCKTLSFQNPRLRNVWSYPRQSNEYQILLRGTRWVANQLDKLIPGHTHREYPCINIRIFANPYVFLLFCLIIFLIVRSYLY